MKDSSKYKESLREFQQAFQKDSTLYEALFLSAQVKEEIENFDGAIADLRTLADKKYKLDSTYYRMASNYFSIATNSPDRDKTKYSEAIDWLAKSIAVNPSYLDAYELKAKAEYNSGNFNQAMSTVNTLLKLDSTNVEYLILRAALKSTLGNIQGGLEDLDRIINSNYRDSTALALAYQRRGLLNERRSLLSDALHDLTEAIRLNPKHELSYMVRGRLHLRMKNPNSACDDFRKAANLGYLPAYDYIKKNCQ